MAYSDDVWDLVSSIHKNTDDFDEGDLYSRIFACATYDLVDIDIAELDPEEFSYSESKIEEYSQKETPFPPIVIHKIGDSYFIIDGVHRVKAALKRKDKKISAYVGINPIYDENLDDEDLE